MLTPVQRDVNQKCLSHIHDCSSCSFGLSILMWHANTQKLCICLFYLHSSWNNSAIKTTLSMCRYFIHTTACSKSHPSKQIFPIIISPAPRGIWFSTQMIQDTKGKYTKVPQTDQLIQSLQSQTNLETTCHSSLVQPSPFWPWDWILYHKQAQNIYTLAQDSLVLNGVIVTIPYSSLLFTLYINF